MGNTLPAFLDHHEDLVKKNLIHSYYSIANPSSKEYVEYSHLTEMMKLNYLFLNLDLQFYQISLVESEFLAKAFKTNLSIVKINLSRIKLDDEMFIHIVENGLKHMRNIKMLDFSHNLITCRGIDVLCKQLTLDSRITHLDVSYNRMGTSGMISMGSMIQYNQSITHLNISFNYQTFDDNVIFYDKLNLNMSILYFRTNFFKRRELEFVKKIISRNIASKSGDYSKVDISFVDVTVK